MSLCWKRECVLASHGVLSITDNLITRACSQLAKYQDHETGEDELVKDRDSYYKEGHISTDTSKLQEAVLPLL